MQDGQFERYNGLSGGGGKGRAERGGEACHNRALIAKPVLLISNLRDRYIGDIDGKGYNAEEKRKKEKGRGDLGRSRDDYDIGLERSHKRRHLLRLAAAVPSSLSSSTCRHDSRARRRIDERRKRNADTATPPWNLIGWPTPARAVCVRSSRDLLSFPRLRLAELWRAAIWL